MADDKPSVFDKFRDTLEEAADSSLGMIKKGTQTVTVPAGKLADGISDIFQSSVNSVRDTVQGARNLAAEVVSTSGSVAGFGAGIAGEVTLISAGFFPFLVFGGMPLQMGAAFSEYCDGLSKYVRGDTPQFMGVGTAEEGLIFTYGRWDS